MRPALCERKNTNNAKRTQSKKEKGQCKKQRLNKQI